MISKDMCPIDWAKTFREIDCQVRGLLPWPVATASFGENIYKVFKVIHGTNKTEKCPGTVISTGKNGIEVACADGTVFITELQAPGGKRMSAADYLRGHAL